MAEAMGLALPRAVSVQCGQSSPLERADRQAAAGLGLIFEGGQGGVEARLRPRMQVPHGCEPLGVLEYPTGWIEWPDYEDQHRRGQCKEANQSVFKAQLMWTKHLYRGLDTGSGQRAGREEAQV